MRIERLDHVAIEVDDFDGRLETLTTRCSMRLLRTGRRHRTGQRIALLGDGTGVKIELIEGDSPTPTFVHLAFRVDDVGAAHEQFLDSDWHSESEPHELPAAKAETALVSDGAGLALQLIRYEPDSPDVAEWEQDGRRAGSDVARDRTGG